MKFPWAGHGGMGHRVRAVGLRCGIEPPRSDHKLLWGRRSVLGKSEIADVLIWIECSFILNVLEVGEGIRGLLAMIDNRTVGSQMVLFRTYCMTLVIQHHQSCWMKFILIKAELNMHTCHRQSQWLADCLKGQGIRESLHTCIMCSRIISEGTIVSILILLWLPGTCIVCEFMTFMH